MSLQQNDHMPTVFLSIRSKSFSAADTLTSGQCFRWTQRGGRLCGTAFGRYVEIEQQDDGIRIFGADGGQDESLWRQYLDLDRDYDEIRRTVTGIEPRLNDSAQYASGVHILAQEPWEALCSFVISQNNNIPRIRGIISRLCLHYGEPAVNGAFAADPAEGHAFPTPQALARVPEETFRQFGCGYRAGYLTDVSRRVAEGEIDFDYIKKAPINEARKRLLSLKGVGPKVAECALLYGFGRLECFPVDVWIRRALETEFTGGTALTESRYAGVAQQYIFEYIRRHPDRFVKEK